MIQPRPRLVLATAGFAAAAALVFASCSDHRPLSAATLPQVGSPGENGVVVKSRAVVPVLVTAQGRVVGSAQPVPAPSATTSATQPIEVTNAANTSMTVDNTGWIVPTVTNGMVDFGTLAIASLFDNNLNVCGADANEHCGAAMFRMYTTGKPGAGVWNDADADGAPILASLGSGAPPGTVGLNVEGAYTLQSIEIPANKHVVRLSDFAPPPRYDIEADFTDAGAGTYATTLVIEYALAPSVTPNPTPTPVPSATPTPVPTPTMTLSR